MIAASNPVCVTRTPIVWVNEFAGTVGAKVYVTRLTTAQVTSSVRRGSARNRDAATHRRTALQTGLAILRLVCAQLDAQLVVVTAPSNAMAMDYVLSRHTV